MRVVCSEGVSRSGAGVGVGSVVQDVAAAIVNTVKMMTRL